MIKFLKSLFGTAIDFKSLREEGAIIVDVRTPAEFQSGHIEGSVNIPLDLIDHQVPDLLKEKKVVITVCRSGTRSAIAVSKLKKAGIEAYNGGGWTQLNKKF
ncbi:MAG TPA: rhodanese-like domain-containing protein [Flavihumibacter sp.]|jgi:phage shock protein E